MFTNPVQQQHLAQELHRERELLWQDQHALPHAESVLESLVRRLRRLIGHRPLRPLASEAS